MKKVLYVASEAVPFIKTGGLADVVGSLPKCFPKEHFDVRVIIPKYACIKQELKDQLHYVTNFYMDLNWRQQYVGIFETVCRQIWKSLHFFLKRPFLFFR